MDWTLIKAEIKQNFSRALITVLIIAIAVTIIIAFNTLTQSYKISSEEPFRSIGVNMIVQKKKNASASIKNMEGIRLPFSNVPFEREELEKIKKIEGVEVSQSLLLWEMVKGKFITILGIDTKGHNIGANRIKNWIVKGYFPKEENEIAVEKHFAKFYKLKAGGRFKITGKEFKVSGQIGIKEGNQLSAANVYMNISSAQELINIPNSVNTLYIAVKDMGKIEKIKKDILTAIPDAVISSSNSVLDSAGLMAKITDTFSLIITISTVFFAFILILKVMFSSLTERIRDIGILKAIGWTNAEIKKEIISESVIQNIIGGVLGILISIIIVWFISFISIDISLQGQTPPVTAAQYAAATNDTVLKFILLPKLYLSVFFGSIIIGTICSLILVKKILCVRPAEILLKL